MNFGSAIRPQFGNNERDALGHEAGNERHVARETVELGHQDRAAMSPASGQRRGKLRPSVEGIGALAAHSAMQNILNSQIGMSRKEMLVPGTCRPVKVALLRAGASSHAFHGGHRRLRLPAGAQPPDIYGKDAFLIATTT